MRVLVHPQLGLLCGAALPFFFSQKNITLDKHILLKRMFDQNLPNLLLTRGAIIKTGILTLIEFW